MIASDIHGCAYYCAKMLDAFWREKADRLILLGDILYHGPRNEIPPEYAPKKVVEMLNGIKEKILCVRGNCDSEVDQMVLGFPIFPDALTFYVKKHMILAVHGHRADEKLFSLLGDGDVLLCGHTHVPECESTGGFMRINPGSVSMPKQDSYNGYILMEATKLYWKDFEGEVHNKFDIREGKRK